ncbi:hypothetical protein F5I97DRAFT_1934709 [Phlebopus sp. FC_14]|nr:hypothetical protein F5I97DRAFT_1934709 [Phlebopus sp. FC_14]
MNFNVNDNPLLVAPRPVRVAAVYPQFGRSAHLKLVTVPTDPERVKIPEETENLDDHKYPPRLHSASSDRESYSPRMSPRSSLPSEALEEFLSILRPAMLAPSSPILRPRRNGAMSLPAFGASYRSKAKIDSVLSKGEHTVSNSAEESDVDKHQTTGSPDPIAEHLTGNWDSYATEMASRWHAQVLGSPISRMHTRNPFPRYASHDVALSGILSASSSPVVPSAPISPAEVPLPLPSPDEMLEVF